MSGADTRLDRLLPALSVQERAALILRNFKVDKPQDRLLLNAAPDRQAAALNRLIGLMNAANGDLAHVIVIIRERVRQEDLRFGWLEWARLCALEMWAIGARFHLCAREPIIESAYRQREAEARAELIPVEECATVLTERQEEWDDADCETDEDGDRVATDAAWYRVRGENAEKLRALVAAGTLAGKGKGRRLQIECGSFYDWLGEPVPVVPDLGIEYDVRPDSQARAVARDRDDHEFIRHLLDRGACNFELPLDMESPLLVEPSPKGFGLELARVLAVRIRSGVQENWRELRAIEEQVASMTEEFEGEDVLHPRVRAHFDEAKAMLVELHEKLQKYTGPFELPEPDQEVRAMVQHIVDNEVRHVPMR